MLRTRHTIFESSTNVVMINTPPDEDLEMHKMGLLAEEMRSASPPAPKEVAKPQKGLWGKVIDGFCICLNIASTVILVFLNNWSVYPARRLGLYSNSVYIGY